MTGGAIESSPAIGSDGTIYVGSDDYYLYAITSTGIAVSVSNCVALRFNMIGTQELLSGNITPVIRYCHHQSQDQMGQSTWVRMTIMYMQSRRRVRVH